MNNMKVIKIIAVFSIIMSLWHFTQSISVIFRNFLLIKYLFILCLSIMYLISGIGLLRLKNWARYLISFLMIHFLYFLIKLTIDINKIAKININQIKTNIFFYLILLFLFIIPIFVCIFLNLSFVQNLFVDNKELEQNGN